MHESVSKEVSGNKRSARRGTRTIDSDEEKKDFKVPQKIFDRLFPHQRIGIEWMYRLFRHRKGGVLGDDMGLGKTV